MEGWGKMEWGKGEMNRMNEVDGMDGMDGVMGKEGISCSARPASRRWTATRTVSLTRENADAFSRPLQAVWLGWLRVRGWIVLCFADACFGFVIRTTGVPPPNRGKESLESHGK